MKPTKFKLIKIKDLKVGDIFSWAVDMGKRGFATPLTWYKLTGILGNMASFEEVKRPELKWKLYDIKTAEHRLCVPIYQSKEELIIEKIKYLDNRCNKRVKNELCSR